MEGGKGKLFIGGISWDTNEDNLREYFERYGDVVEAVIMKDRTTGRARGFGFVVFSDSLVADEVVKAKHSIDGRTVEAKKAVPRDAQHVFNRNSSSTHSSPGLTRTKKIFVGGLPSSATESDFKKYFDQFGTITDSVVMYDHHTQRPRGFGYITYDSEDAVEMVLFKPFHELNGKMVEVKPAVPKEVSPRPSRILLDGHGYDLNRVSNFLTAYSQGYHPNSARDYGIKMGGWVSPSVGRSANFPFGSTSSYNLGSTFESGLGSTYGGIEDLRSTVGLGRELGTFYGSNSRRNYNPPGHGVISGTRSLENATSYNVWDNENFRYDSIFLNPSDGTDLVGGSIGPFSAFANTAGIWDSSVSGQDRRNVTSIGSNISNRVGESKFVSGIEFSRDGVNNIGATSSYASRNDSDVRTIQHLYGKDYF